MARRFALRLAGLLGLCCLFFACGGAGKKAPASASSSAVLIVRCAVQDAEVWLDSKYLREVAELERGVRVPPGKHRIEVRRTSFHSMYYELDLQPKERRVLEVDLAPRFR